MTQDPVIRRVAVALFDGFTALDAYGPVQAFGACRLLQPDGAPLRYFQVFTLGEQPGPAQLAGAVLVIAGVLLSAQ